MTSPIKKRPLTDYRKTKLLEEYHKNYALVSEKLMELMNELHNMDLTDEELNLLNKQVETLVTELARLNQLIEKYY